MRIFFANLLIGSLAIANAHFLLDYPQTRGFDEDNEVLFCGGFSTVSSRSQFPLGAGIISITSEHPTAEISIGMSFKANPTTFADFFNATSSNGNQIPFLTPFTTMHSQGDACFPVNPNNLNVSEATDGANATILVQFNGPDGLLYQCADVTLSQSFAVPNATKCDNATGAFPSSPSSGVSSTTSVPSSTASASSSSAPASTLVTSMAMIGAATLFVAVYLVV
ncbi:hypothetical protein BU17DRAFT_81105 [Hysterangium stoloniferum]|nr:hypothetical protein BU17DRAFT_81105 [Hysterangium stoloniferum]